MHSTSEFAKIVLSKSRVRARLHGFPLEELVQTVRKRFRQRAMHPVSQSSTLNQSPSQNFSLRRQQEDAKPFANKKNTV